MPSDDREPTVGYAHAPIWLIILFGLLVYWGQLYLDEHGGGFDPRVYEAFASYKQVVAANPQQGPAMLIAKGQALYQLCSACHQPNGLGTAGLFPPLAGSEWVTEPNPARLIRIPLHGLTGPIEVSGQQWNGAMAALGGSLSNEDLAAILTYIRQAWGNDAPPVTPEEVAAVRTETASRPEDGTAPWTAQELLQIPVPAPATPATP